MAKIIIGMYEEFNTAEQVIQSLIDAGFKRESISLVSQRQADTLEAQVAKAASPEAGQKDALEDMGTGAVFGGIAGLVVGLGALMVPGLGWILAAGPIATLVAATGAGAAAGSILGALSDLGIPEGPASLYAESLRRGATMVAVQANDAHAQTAVEILNRYQPVDIESHAEGWRAAGWTGFDETEELPESNAINRQRARYGHPIQTDDEHLGLERSPYTEPFVEYIPDFRQHYEAYYTHTTYLFDEYEPAYRYGYQLGSDPTYAQKDWDEIEARAQRDWENKHPNLEWEEFKEAVRHSWATLANRK